MSANTDPLKGDKKTDSNSVKSICEIFEDQAAKTPDSIALDYKETLFSYKLLNEKANQLAAHIRTQYQQITKQALTTNTLIAISVGRSADYVIGILGILKAGAAYAPINPDYPSSRIQHILQDINATLILTYKSHFTDTFEKISTKLKPIFIEETAYLKESTTNLNLSIKATDLAYVIYTSGSSGKPKGILAEQINVLSQVLSANYFKADSSDTIAFFSDVSFDSTTFEIWGALLNGSRLFIPEDLFELLSNPDLFKQKVLEKKISIILLTRSLFDLLYKLDETVFASLTYLLVGAEALTKNLMLQLLQSNYKPKNLLNAYGPSENSTFCTTFLIKKDFSHLSSVPIGRPYSNRVGFVLDKHQQLMPIGVTGELYVGGPSLSRGYLNQPELTQKSFIPNPFFKESGEKYARIYKTNDLVKWLPEGNLEYAGRNDFQIKLRGYRIELSEIETRLLTFDGIKHAVVVLNNHQGFSFLVAYYVANSAFEDASIRKHLADGLPEYMIPTVFVYLKTLPVTTNGKLDRKALPPPHYQPKAISKQEESKNSVEQKIYQIWAKVLNLENFGKDCSFFDLGGNSLIAMSIRKELEDAFHIQFNIVELFVHTTLAELSKRISELLQTDEAIKKQKISEPTSALDSLQNEPIAVVGMACRLPGISNVDAFWELLINEESNLTDFSNEELFKNQVREELFNQSNYVKRGAVFEDSFAFDAGFFGYSVKDATLMDPQQRQFLECAWEAMEHSGNVPDKFKGDIGVFASQGRNYYFMDNVYSNTVYATSNDMFQAILANEKDFLSTRISFKLNLTGPSLTLQTACSSSLVSVQLACESLKTKSADMVLAGGVSIFYNRGYPYQADLIESPDGYCRAFDKDAKGTVVTSGVAVVVLKRLSDAIQQKDTIYALIKGGAINNDGSSKMAFTAPSVQGQTAVIEKALKNANLSPESISYIEAHGTGTTLGDPIEWLSLHKVYQKYTEKKAYCTIGSVKTNIGHTDSAAGVFGLIKTILALKHQCLPATLHFKTLNPEISSFNNLFRISNSTAKWETTNVLRRAAVSSFGLGGTNAHLILEEYPENPTSKEQDNKATNSNYYLIPFSAKNRAALYAMAQALERYFTIDKTKALNDIAFTLQQGRAEFKERGYYLLFDSDEIRHKIVQSYIRDGLYSEKPEIVFILSEIAHETFTHFSVLYKKYPDFKKSFDTAAAIILKKTGQSLHFDRVEISSEQRTLLLAFTIQYSFSQLLQQAKIKPTKIFSYAADDNLIQLILGQKTLTQAIDHLLGDLTKPTFRYDSLRDEVAQLSSKAETLYLELGQSPNIGFTKPNKFYFVPTSEISIDKDFLDLIGWLWSQGVDIFWESIHFAASKKVNMPTYRFTKTHYELKKSGRMPEKFPLEDLSIRHTSSIENQLKEIWSVVLGIAIEELNDSTDFIELGGDSLALIQLIKQIERSFSVQLKPELIIDNAKFGAILHFIESKMVKNHA